MSVPREIFKNRILELCHEHVGTLVVLLALSLTFIL